MTSCIENIKIAYIGGGSRGWAWNLMSDLARTEELSGSVDLYDIDFAAAQANAVIGNRYQEHPETKSRWTYRAVKTIEEALDGASFVILSILPGTFEHMASDVHAPEAYGIYQSVGDTTGPGGILRAMRTIPMYETFAERIRACAPDAWVINYTNPMTLCTRTLYRVFPDIKAFGCCHEVFGGQKLLACIAAEYLGIPRPDRHEIKVNPIGVNHFTWLTDARYRDVDLIPLYERFADEHPDGYTIRTGSNPKNDVFSCKHLVKFDLFRRYGVIAAAGDRHLAEFCEGGWYLKDPDRVAQMGFSLTSVDWRKQDLANKLARRERLVRGEESVRLTDSGEEGVNQMRAILGLGDLVTNVNLPNRGQVPNLPLGAVVETNAVFRSGSVSPVLAGNIPESIFPLVSRICGEQEALSTAIAERDVRAIFACFVNDPLVTCSLADARELFRTMCDNTREFLTGYDLSALS